VAVRFVAVALVVVGVFGLSGVGMADEEMIPLAESGEWVAVAHHVSMTAPPDVCIAMNLARGTAFRADENGVQFRVQDQKWSLPSDVQGNISVTIGSWKQSFDIDSNTSVMVSSEVSSDIALEMFSEMDKSSSMSVTVWKEKPNIVSLTGSTKATNAFRTCAGIKSNAESPGSNPFK
jgi:hypothetical protein